MELRHPSLFEPQLTDEVISFFARHMLDIYRDINYLLSTDDDSNYGRGTSIFDRTRNRFLNLIVRKQCPVDVHLTDGSLKFIFQIGNASIRFLKDDFEKPKKKKFLMQQIQSFSLFPLDDHQPHFWRFILNEPKTLDDEPLVVFAGYNLANDVVAYWDSNSITDINHIHLVEPKTPASVELGSPLVEDLDIEDKDDEDSIVVNN